MASIDKHLSKILIHSCVEKGSLKIHYKLTHTQYNTVIFIPLIPLYWQYHVYLYRKFRYNCPSLTTVLYEYD